jgi:GTP cyclohydrolase II
VTELADAGRGNPLERVVDVGLPTRYGNFRAIGYSDRATEREQVALVHGVVTGRSALTRAHSECLTGDVFGSTRCECGEQLAAALRAIVAEGAGVLIYLQGHEGRGIGLLAKLKAMRLQEQGLDTVEANLALGLPVDARDYRAAAWILRDLGVRSVRLLSNNPDKFASLWRSGIRVTELVPLLVTPNQETCRTCAPSGSGSTTCCLTWTPGPARPAPRRTTRPGLPAPTRPSPPRPVRAARPLRIRCRRPGRG